MTQRLGEVFQEMNYQRKVRELLDLSCRLPTAVNTPRMITYEELQDLQHDLTFIDSHDLTANGCGGVFENYQGAAKYALNLAAQKYGADFVVHFGGRLLEDKGNTLFLKFDFYKK